MAQPVPAGARPKRVIAVLGMHRSGTSALTGSLEQRGLFLGQVSQRNRHNPKGNREHPGVPRLNEDVLRASGGAWHTPPPVVTWEAEHRERAASLLAEHADRDLWGFKDPRTLLTLGGWLELVPDLERIGVFRDPMRVADSLQRRAASSVERRDPIGTDQAVALWEAYNRALLEELRRRPFPVLCFDDEPDVLREKLVEASAALGLLERPGEELFFTPDLRHAEPTAPAPPGARALYEELRALAL